jgi:ribosomal protein L25 (general stress protein Ctc)
MAEATIKAHTRTEFGQGPNRRLRATGLVPGVIYQKGEPSLAFATEGHELWMLLGQGGGRRKVVEISIDEAPPMPAVFVEWQLDPVRGEIRHVDFKQVDPADIAATNRRLEAEASSRANARNAALEQAAASRAIAAEAEAAGGGTPPGGEVADDADIVEAGSDDAPGDNE